MKRHMAVVMLLLLFLALSFTLSVNAGGSGFVRTFDLPTDPASEGPLAGVDPRGQTVTYWHQHRGDREAVLNEMVAEFNENNPWDITVEASNQGHYGEIYQKMIAGIASGELPDLVVAFQGQAATYQLDGALVDMDVFVNDAQWGFNEDEQTDFFEGFFRHDISPQFGMRLGFPLSRSMEILYVNMDALAELGYDAPPITWTEFGEMACAWTSSGTGRIGFVIRTDVSFVAAATFGLGGDIFNYDSDEYVYDSAETVYFLEFLQGLLGDNCAALPVERNSDRADFANQVALFYVGSSAAIPYVNAAIAEIGSGDFNWAAAPLPYADLGAEAPTQKINGASVSIPATTPERELAAWLFVRWFAEPEQQARWAQVTNYFPVRASAEESMADYLADNPQYAATFPLLARTHVVPPLAGYDVVRNMLTEAFFDIMDGADVETRLARLSAEANTVYQTQFQP